MPAERIYEPQVSPGRTAGASQASAVDFGTQTGATIMQVGDTLHRAAITEYKIDREQKANTEAAAIASSQAQQRLDDAKFIADGRTVWTPGYADQVAARLKAQREALEAAPIVEDSTRQQTLAQFDRYAASVNASEYEFDAVKQAGLRVTHHVDANDASFMTIRTATDPQALPREMAARIEAINAAPGIGDDVKEKLTTEYEQGAFAAHIEGLIDKGQAKQAMTLLDSGTLPLDQRQFGALRNAAEVEMHRQDAVVANQQRIAEKGQREEEQTISTLVDGGVDVPAPRIQQAIATATARGDTSTAAALGIKLTQSTIAKGTTPWTPQQYDARLSYLAAKKDRTPTEDVELKYLPGLRDNRVREMTSDPALFGARNNMPAPPPNDVQGRLKWSRDMTGLIGRPVLPVLPQEIEQLKTQAASSPQGTLEVANQLAQFGGQAAFAIGRAMNNDNVARLSVLTPVQRQSSINGAALRDKRRDLFDASDTSASFRQAWDAKMGWAVSQLNPTDVEAMRQISLNLYADYAVKHGNSGYVRDVYDGFIDSAIGGYKSNSGRLGGVGTWQRVPVILPAKATQQSFDHVLTTMAWSKDNPHAPYYRDGKTQMTPAQVRQYVPTLRPDNLYEFHGPNNSVLREKDGVTPFVLDLAKLSSVAP